MDIEKYSIGIANEYLFPCGGFVLPPLSSNAKKIGKSEVNSDTIDVCITGRVRLTVNKMNEGSKDVLEISEVIKTGSLTYFWSVFRAHGDAVFTYYYFPNRIHDVEYKFVVSKVSGEVVEWTTTATIEPKTTNELDVSF